MNDEVKVAELLPCPFCGSQNIDPKGWASTDRAGPACDDCGASAGDTSGSLQDNIAAWNRRAALARQEADNASSPNVIYRWRALDYSGFCYGSNPPHDLPPEACLTAFYRGPEGLRSALHEISATGNLTATDKQFSRHLQQIARDALAGAAPPSAPVGQEIAYLDLGVGGYIDLGSAMTDEQLAKLPKGRHALGIIGTYGVDGYVAAPPPAPVGQEPVAWLHLQTGEILQKPWNPSDPHEHCNDEPVPLYAAPPAAQADDDWHLRGYAYASKQATTCAGCGEHKHTPLRIDAMGGYVCLTCIDNKLSSLLGEFGYTAAQAVDLEKFRKLEANWRRIADTHGVRQFSGNDHLLFSNELRALIDQQAGKGFVMGERIIELHDGERVVAVVPCRAAGPGWSNAPTWVHIVNYKTGTHREECIQPEERSEALNYIYYIGESVHAALYASVRTRPAKRKTRAGKGSA